MAEKSNDTHIVEIPTTTINQDDQNQQTKTAIMIQQHPMMEISKSPGHLLLLKLWQREEHLNGNRITLNETKLDHLRREIFHLCCSFFVFHALATTLLFTSTTTTTTDDPHDIRCSQWWAPSLATGSTSAAIAVLVQVKLWRYWKVTERLRRERCDCRTLGRAIQELRMKGANFDLAKDNLSFTSSKKKSSSVEIKWKPKIWCSNNLVTFCLVVFAALAFPAPKLFLCII